MTANKSPVARSAAVNLIGYLVPLVVALAAIPVTVRALGPDRFGLLALTWVVLAYSAVVDLGVARATTKFAAQAIELGDDERLGRLAQSAVVANAVVGVCAGSALALLNTHLVTILNLPMDLVPEARAALYVVAAGVPVILVGTPIRAVLEAGYRFDLVNLVTIPASSLLYAIPAAGASMGLDVVAIVALIVLSKLLSTAAFAVLAYRTFQTLLRPHQLDRASLLNLISFGGWVTVSGVAGAIFAYTDRLFITLFRSLGALTYYAVPYEVVARVWIIPNAVSAAVFPAFSRLRSLPDGELALVYERVLHSLVWLVQPITVILILFAEEILRVWVGEDIAAPGAPVLRILAVGVLVNSTAFVPFALIQGANRPDLTGKLQGAALVPFLLANAASAQALGGVGIGLSLTIRLSLEAALLFGTAAIVVPAVSRVHREPRTVVGVSAAIASLAGAIILQLTRASMAARLLYALFAIGIASIFIVSHLRRPEGWRSLREALRGRSRTFPDSS